MCAVDGPSGCIGHNTAGCMLILVQPRHVLPRLGRQASSPQPLSSVRLPAPPLASLCLPPAVADILGEAAAQRDWSIQEMLLEAAKLEVSAAAQAAEAGTAGGADSDAESAGYESALADDDAASFLSASPGSARSGSLGSSAFTAAAALAAAAAAASDEEDPAAGGSSGRWIRLDSRSASAAAVRQLHWQRQGTPPPRALSVLLERSSGGPLADRGPASSRDQWRPAEQWPHSGGGSRLRPQHQPLFNPPSPARAPSWRRGATRSPSPERCPPSFRLPCVLAQIWPGSSGSSTRSNDSLSSKFCPRHFTLLLLWMPPLLLQAGGALCAAGPFCTDAAPDAAAQARHQMAGRWAQAARWPEQLRVRLIAP